MNLKEKIKNLREMNGWSQEVMAERLDMLIRDDINQQKKAT